MAKQPKGGDAGAAHGAAAPNVYTVSICAGHTREKSAALKELILKEYRARAASLAPGEGI